MSAQSLLQDMEREGVTLSIVADGQLAVDGPRVALDRWLPEIRIAKPDLLALLSKPANAPAPPTRWLVTTTEGEVFSLSRTPPGTLAEIQADYPGAQVEIEPEPAAGAALHPADQSIGFAYLRFVGEDDLGIGQEWLDGLARDPERLRQMYAETVRLGLATFDPAPEQPIEDASRVAVCGRCKNWTPSPINPEGGMGRCLTDAPASRRPGACWPWLDADVRCNQFRGTSQ